MGKFALLPPFDLAICECLIVSAGCTMDINDAFLAVCAGGDEEATAAFEWLFQSTGPEP